MDLKTVKGIDDALKSGITPEVYSNEQAQVKAEEIFLEAQSTKPLPLKRDLSPSELFPIAALGDILGPAAQTLYEVIQAPLALCGQSLLAAATLASQSRANVEVDGRVSPLSENFVTVGVSGERKTAVDREALHSARAYQRILRDRYDFDLLEFEKESDAYNEAKAATIRTNKKKGRSAIKSALDELGSPPEAPVFPMILMEEPTYEGLVKSFAVGQPSIGLFTDEGGMFLGGYGMNQENQLKTAAGLSKLWDGGEISRVRSGDGASLMYGKRLATHLMMQPIVAAQFFDNKVLGGQGFLARYLICSPESTIGTRKYKEAELSRNPAIIKYRSRLSSIFEQAMSLDGNRKNELKLRSLALNSDAKRIWIRFHDEIESEMGERGKYSDMHAFGSKSAEHVLRLAGTLSLIGNPAAVQIAALEIDCGIELVRYYLSEAIRVREGAMVAPELAQAEVLHAWLVSQPSSYVHLAMIYQFGPPSFREAAVAKKIMTILEQHGWVVSLGAKELDGIKRKEVWVVRKMNG